MHSEAAQLDRSLLCKQRNMKGASFFACAVSLRKNQFVLFQIDDYLFEFVQKIHTQDSVYVLSKTFGNVLHVHGKDSMIPPKYGPKFQRSLCEDTSARITRTLLRGDCIPQTGAGDINKLGIDGGVVRAGV
jgi:hypothetical protein